MSNITVISYRHERNVISTGPKNLLTSRIDFTVLLLFKFFTKITCLLGKLKTEFTSLIAKSTSPGLSDTTFFACWDRKGILGHWQDMWNTLMLFLEVAIKWESNSWEVRRFQLIFWNVIKSHVTTSKQTVHNFVMATPREHDTWQHWIKVWGWLIPIGLKINWVKFTYANQGLDWVFLSLFHYSLLWQTGGKLCPQALL